MDATGTIVSAYDVSDEGADAVALAKALATATGGDVEIAGVYPASPSTLLDRSEQQELFHRIQNARHAIVAAVPAAKDDGFVPITDTHLARALHGLAEAEHAWCIVFGSSHHGAVGRALLGTSADAVVHGAACPVAIAPPGFRDRPVIEPARVTVAYDGTPPAVAALGFGRELADRLGAELRIVGVQQRWDQRPLPGTGEPHVERAIETLGLPQAVVLHGDPAKVLIDEAARAGVLVMGTRERSPARRALGGSVSARVVAHAASPVLLCPARSAA